MPFELRTAKINDAESLSAFCETTFRDTFSKDNSKEDMDLYITKSFHPQEQKREILDSKRVTLLACLGNEIIGFYQLLDGKPELEIRGIKPIELLRLYVSSEWHGKGVAQALMENCITTARQKGFDTIWLGVWEKNLRAQSFYLKWGFNQVGSHIFQLGNDPQRDLLFSKSLDLKQP